MFYETLDEEHQESHKTSISRYKEYLDELLQRFQKSTNKLTPKLRHLLMDRSYFLDIHQTANYQQRYFKGEPVVYLGKITEKHRVRLPSKNLFSRLFRKEHIFLMCRSDDERQRLLTYPLEFQPESEQVYTLDDVTWME